MTIPVTILSICLTALVVNFIRSYNRHKRIEELSQEWHTLNRKLMSSLRNVDDYGKGINQMAFDGEIPESMDFIPVATDEVAKSSEIFGRMTEIHGEIVRLKAIR